MKKAPKNLASQVYNAHDKADGNREKKSENVRWLFQVILMVEDTSKMMESIIVLTFKNSSTDTETIMAWKSKGLSDESIQSPNIPGNSFARKL